MQTSGSTIDFAGKNGFAPVVAFLKQNNPQLQQLS
jgi:hypothetical protein